MLQGVSPSNNSQIAQAMVDKVDKKSKEKPVKPIKASKARAMAENIVHSVK